MNASNFSSKRKATHGVGKSQPKQTHMSASEYQRRYSSTVKDSKRVYKGRRNNENGKLFENMLETASKKYEAEGLAKVLKSIEPFRAIGVLNVSPLVFKCVEEKEGETNYKGIMRMLGIRTPSFMKTGWVTPRKKRRCLLRAICIPHLRK